MNTYLQSPVLCVYIRFLIMQGCDNNPGRCTFEQRICGDWHQEIDDDFDWSRTKQSTGTYGTGPSADHTLGTSQGNITNPYIDLHVYYGL